MSYLCYFRKSGKLARAFESDFPGCYLLPALAEFSLPTALGEQKSNSVSNLVNRVCCFYKHFPSIV